MQILKHLEKASISNHRGFTLTEVVVVASIIGILAVAVMGSFVAMRPTLNMHSYGRDLIAAAQAAKLEAVKRNTCMGMQLVPAAAPPADLTGVANRGSYWVFIDDGTGGGTACDAIMQAGEQAHPQFAARPVLVPQDVALTPSPVGVTNADPNYDAGPPIVTDLFTTISFNARSIVANTTWPGATAIVLRNDPDPAEATWWGRVVVNSLGGSMTYQTNNNPANEGNWSE